MENHWRIQQAISRRDWLTVSAALGLTALAPRALADESGFAELGCTPLFVGSGPYYPAVETLPWASDLTRMPGKDGQAAGQILYVFGKISDSQCNTISDAKVEIWQSDMNGYYRHPVDMRLNQKPLDPYFQYFGHVVTQVDGFYMFKTILPRWYEVFGYIRSAHIHFRIKHPDYGEVTTQLMFDDKEGEELRKKDLIYLGLPDFIKPLVVQPFQKPTEFPDLAERLKMEPDALVCRFDQAFV